MSDKGTGHSVPKIRRGIILFSVALALVSVAFIGSLPNEGQQDDDTTFSATHWGSIDLANVSNAYPDLYVRSGSILYIKAQAPFGSWDHDYRIYQSGSHGITNVVIEQNRTVSITLDSVTLNGNITLNNGADLTLLLKGNNTVNGHIVVPEGRTITIDSADGAAGSIRINGSTSRLAGIGGGFHTDGGNITINGGTITVRGGPDGAGIGGGFHGDGGVITINGGVVNATGGTDGAGIGGGFQGDGGNVKINGGVVTARGSAEGAGIGGSKNGAGAVLNIGSAATVYAYSKGTLPAIHASSVQSTSTGYFVNVSFATAPYTAGKTVEIYSNGTLITKLTLPANYRNFGFAVPGAGASDVYRMQIPDATGGARDIVRTSGGSADVYPINGHSTNYGASTAHADKKVLTVKMGAAPGFTVTEKHVDIYGQPINVNDSATQVKGSATYGKAMPNISGWAAAGYKINSPPTGPDDDGIVYGHPSGIPVSANITVYFIYWPAEMPSEDVCPFCGAVCTCLPAGCGNTLCRACGGCDVLCDYHCACTCPAASCGDRLCKACGGCLDGRSGNCSGCWDCWECECPEAGCGTGRACDRCGGCLDVLCDICSEADKCLCLRTECGDRLCDECGMCIERLCDGCDDCGRCDCLNFTGCLCLQCLDCYGCVEEECWSCMICEPCGCVTYGCDYVKCVLCKGCKDHGCTECTPCRCCDCSLNTPSVAPMSLMRIMTFCDCRYGMKCGTCLAHEGSACDCGCVDPVVIEKKENISGGGNMSRIVNVYPGSYDVKKMWLVVIYETASTNFSFIIKADREVELFYQNNVKAISVRLTDGIVKDIGGGDHKGYIFGTDRIERKTVAYGDGGKPPEAVEHPELIPCGCKVEEYGMCDCRYGMKCGVCIELAKRSPAICNCGETCKPPVSISKTESPAAPGNWSRIVTIESGAFKVENMWLVIIYETATTNFSFVVKADKQVELFYQNNVKAITVRLTDGIPNNIGGGDHNGYIFGSDRVTRSL